MEVSGNLVGPDLELEAPHEELFGERLHPNAARRKKPREVWAFPDDALYGPLEPYRVRTAIVRSDLYADAPPIRIAEPEDVGRMLRNMGNLDQEYFLVIGLNAKNEVTFLHEAGVGGAGTAGVEALQVIKLAILTSSRAVICVHNHPSGDASPSEDDLVMTKRLQSLCDCVGVALLDHLIIGHNHGFSILGRSTFRF